MVECSSYEAIMSVAQRIESVDVDTQRNQRRRVEVEASNLNVMMRY